MPYELRIAGAATRFETEPEAVAAAKDALLADPDAEPEIIDLASGNPAAPGASRRWRDDLKKGVR